MFMKVEFMFTWWRIYWNDVTRHQNTIVIIFWIEPWYHERTPNSIVSLLRALPKGTCPYYVTTMAQHYAFLTAQNSRILLLKKCSCINGLRSFIVCGACDPKVPVMLWNSSVPKNLTMIVSCTNLLQGSHIRFFLWHGYVTRDLSVVKSERLGPDIFVVCHCTGGSWDFQTKLIASFFDSDVDSIECFGIPHCDNGRPPFLWLCSPAMD